MITMQRSHRESVSFYFAWVGDRGVRQYRPVAPWPKGLKCGHHLLCSFCTLWLASFYILPHRSPRDQRVDEHLSTAYKKGQYTLT